MDGRTDGRTDGWTDGRTDGWTDGRTSGEDYLLSADMAPRFFIVFKE